MLILGFLSITVDNMESLVIRKRLMNEIKPFINNSLVKVITGIRRSGKSELLAQVCSFIKQSGVSEENIININFESMKFSSLNTAENLYNYVLKKVEGENKIKGKIYLFLDEIQNVYEWEKAVNSFRVDFDSDIYITGRNLNLLSGELATLLAGRYVSFEVYPFTLSEAKEFAVQNGTFTDNQKLFEDYLKFGGFPQRFQFSDENAIISYLSDIYSSVVLKDVIARNKINNPQFLQTLCNFMLDNVALQFSANSICKKLKSENINVSTDTILTYLNYIQNAFIIRGVKRYDITGKKLLESNEKYYSSDLGLCTLSRTSENVDVSKVYENVVFIELKSRGYSVNIGRLDNKEIDFIAYRGTEKLYIQVAYFITESDLEREFGNLMKINDNFPKLVISSDPVDLSRNGIQHKNIIDWLLEDAETGSA